MKKDLTAQIFGKLTVKRETEKRTKNGEVVWFCMCECGKDTEVGSASLVRGNTKSCGCLVIEIMKKGNNNRKHGLRSTKFYDKWRSINDRCERKSSQCYPHYGGRGIKNLWSNFYSFKEDMYQSYLAHSELHGERHTTLERIDVDGDYCKENCKWATQLEQANNKTNNIVIENGNISMTLAEWGRELGLTYSCLYSRYRKGLVGSELLAVSYQDD